VDAPEEEINEIVPNVLNMVGLLDKRIIIRTNFREEKHKRRLLQGL